MQFKHPEILYFLFLLIIPVIVHLFQLRKFKKEYFTNVRFLKELIVQTRKSSKIKKYLLLATRLLLLTTLIIAFSQPFFKAVDQTGKNNELIILLDNSFSMQAKGKKGELLKRAIQDLLENVPEETTFSILTNDTDFWNTNIKTISKELQNLNYSPIPFSLENSLIKTKSHNNNQGKDILVITDAIGLQTESLTKSPTTNKTFFLIPEAEKTSNAAIDSVFINQTLDHFYEIGVLVSSNFEEARSIPVSLYNQNNLIAKAIMPLNKSKQTLLFTIPKETFSGYVSLQDNSLAFDNTFYFNFLKPKILKILSIGDPFKSNFLSRIYTQPEFNFSNTPLNSLDYRNIENQDCIILNELENIPLAMHTNIKKFVEKGGSLIIIPSEKIPPSNLNSFLKNFANILFLNSQNEEKKITKINFSNPLYNNVFEKKIHNFQYPVTKQSFEIRSNLPHALSYEDQSAFLSTLYKNTGTVFIFSAPLNKENSNFQNAPLIVPTFYKMGTSTNENGIQYQIIGQNKTSIINVDLNKDEIVSITNKEENFIPIQQVLENKLKFSCGDNPKKAGNYHIYQNKKNLYPISFNYDRKESQLIATNHNKINTINSLNNFFETLQLERTDQQIWKWFLILALFFLIIELLIQKFVK
ncbi:BatA domain-containing protein [Flavobacterium covae]|uniref:BatA domain-containing protein n=1 Tax=Flavobacterium covae TaxID=2906076 RepID=UPI001FB83D7E|nr:BatA domain-containing protein [Flavobacterium covae]MCJ1805651.1 BatA domain-containing protein [Flavobacterium covae]